MTAKYGFGVDSPLTVEQAEARVRELLRDEGFGVLTEIDVRSTLREKLGVDFRPYRILGACNPPLAHRALEAEAGIGLLLPCNVVVEAGPAGGSRVSFLDPQTALGLVGNPRLEPIAADAARRLRRVAARLSTAGADRG
jgi:uncharacterized protein (DUF302 family)